MPREILTRKIKPIEKLKKLETSTPIDVKWLSYSSITCPIEKQLLEKGLKFKDPLGAGAFRGQAVEEGVVVGLLDHAASIESCIKVAEEKYSEDTSTQIISEKNLEKNRKVIAPMVEMLIKELRQYGTPEFGKDGQKKIKVSLEDVVRPIIGYIDLFYPKEGLIVDIKTTLKMPQNITSSHGMQGALYSHGAGDNYNVKFVYASSTKCNSYSQTNFREKLEELRLRAIHREYLLDMFDTWEELSKIITPNYDNFYMSSPAMREAGKSVWGY